MEVVRFFVRSLFLMPRPTRGKKLKDSDPVPGKPVSSALKVQKKKASKASKISTILPDGSSHQTTIWPGTTAGDIVKAMEMCWRDPEDDTEPVCTGNVTLPEIGDITFWPPSPSTTSDEIAKALSIWYGVDLKNSKFIQRRV
jgi:hypothetical protein